MVLPANTLLAASRLALTLDIPMIAMRSLGKSVAHRQAMSLPGNRSVRIALVMTMVPVTKILHLHGLLRAAATTTGVTANKLAMLPQEQPLVLYPPLLLGNSKLPRVDNQAMDTVLTQVMPILLAWLLLLRLRECLLCMAVPVALLHLLHPAISHLLLPQVTSLPLPLLQHSRC